MSTVSSTQRGIVLCPRPRNLLHEGLTHHHLEQDAIQYHIKTQAHNVLHQHKTLEQSASTHSPTCVNIGQFLPTT